MHEIQNHVKCKKKNAMLGTCTPSSSLCTPFDVTIWLSLQWCLWYCMFCTKNNAVRKMINFSFYYHQQQRTWPIFYKSMFSGLPELAVCRSNRNYEHCRRGPKTSGVGLGQTSLDLTTTISMTLTSNPKVFLYFLFLYFYLSDFCLWQSPF